MTSLTIAAIESCLSNRLDAAAVGKKSLAGVIGDAPSLYSKSPQLWNAAFQHLSIGALYAPFDVVAAKVGDLLASLRDCEFFLGANVTVPHKVRVMDFLDEIGADAARIQAVNTIVRTSNGKLIGHNTDGEGFVQSILQCQPNHTNSFIPSLNGITVLLLGAGSRFGDRQREDATTREDIQSAAKRHFDVPHEGQHVRYIVRVRCRWNERVLQLELRERELRPQRDGKPGNVQDQRRIEMKPGIVKVTEVRRRDGKPAADDQADGPRTAGHSRKLCAGRRRTDEQADDNGP